MIKITTQAQYDHLLTEYMTIEEAARKQGYSVRHMYRLTYDMEGILTVKLCLPRQRRQQLRLIPRRYELSTKRVEEFAYKLRELVRVAPILDQLPGQLSITDMPYELGTGLEGLDDE